MRNVAIATVLAASLAAMAAAQLPPRSLLFSPSGTERTKSGSAGAYVQWLGPNSVSVVTPDPALTHSAEKFASDWGYQTLAGDTDGSGIVTKVAFMGGVDGLLSLPYKWNAQEQTAEPRTAPVSAYDTYVSPFADVGTTVSGAPGLRKGDCGRFVRNATGNGKVEYLITAEQLISALGMFDPATQQPLQPDAINLDAIAVSMDQHIYVSFDSDHWLRLVQNNVLMPFLLHDGGIACIRNPAWTPDDSGAVAAVVPNRGIIAFSEANVTGMVGNANIADNTAANPATTVDTEGLAIDIEVGGTFAVQWGNQLFNLNNLMISCETLTGVGVISTTGGGTIAVLNGCALAAAAPTPTYGRRMGLQWMPPNQAQSYAENLETLDHEPCYFVLATPNPLHHPVTGAFQVHVGTNLNPLAVLLFSVGTVPVSESADPATLALVGSWFAGNECFPEYYRRLWPAPFGGTSPFPVLLTAAVPLAAAGGGQFGMLAGAAFPTAGSGGVLFQALALDAAGVLHLSAPGTID